MPQDSGEPSSLYRRLQVASKGARKAPTLKLSREALEAPLDVDWLQDLRDFLTRSGAWRQHPTSSVELYAAAPAPGVDPSPALPTVIGPAEPVFTSLGFGSSGVRDGHAIYDSGVCEKLAFPASCDTLICVAHEASRASEFGAPEPAGCSNLDLDATRKGACYDSFCGGNTCLNQNCTSMKCSTQKCSEQFCSDHLCGTHSQKLIARDLAASWDHPFVRELRQYFASEDVDRLEVAILGYVGRNMFDGSTNP